MLLARATLPLLTITLLGASTALGKDIAAELDRGQKLLAAGDLSGALAVFADCATASPRDPRPLYLRGVVLEQSSDIPGAEKAYRQALARDQSFAPAHNNLGAIFLGRKELAAADKELSAASTLDPKNSRAAFNLGLLREAQGQPRAAAAEYRRALVSRPDDGNCHANLCSVLRKLGDADGALAECRQAVRLLPQSAVALTNLGLLLSDHGRLDDARDELTRATHADPELAQAWTGLGRVELRRKQAKAASVALDRAARLAPVDPGIAADYCRALAEQELASQATLAECRKAVGLGPGNALAHYELAKVLVSRGDCAGARAEQGKLSALPGVGAEAKHRAAEIVATCVPGKPATSPRQGRVRAGQ
jgi:Flp pilus assembly protein TadD